jgi:non-homologous end joining protein Ku
LYLESFLSYIHVELSFENVEELVLTRTGVAHREIESGHFHPEKFEDHYEDALKELLKKKQHGEKIEAPPEPTPAKRCWPSTTSRPSIGSIYARPTSSKARSRPCVTAPCARRDVSRTRPRWP